MFLALRQKLETQERPGDIFTPVPLNKRELVCSVNIFTLTLKIKTVSKSGGTFLAQLLKIRRVGTSSGRFYPTLKFIVASD